MPNIPSMTPDDIIRILLKNGFELDRIKGSHRIFINYQTHKRVVVAYHKRDLPKGTLFEIFKQSGINTKEIFD